MERWPACSPRAGSVVLFLVYPSCCTAVFQAFMCDELDDGSAYLRVDYSVQCWAENQGAFSEEYKGVMAYAVLMSFVYPLGTPVLYAAVLYANRAAIAKVDRLERGLWSSNTDDATESFVRRCTKTFARRTWARATSQS